MDSIRNYEKKYIDKARLLFPDTNFLRYLRERENFDEDRLKDIH